MRCLLALALLGCLAPAASAQTERVRYHVEVVAPGPEAGTVVVDGGARLGVVAGGRGQAVSVFQLDEHERGGRVIAGAEVVSVAERTAVVRLTPDPAEDPVAVGDAVELPVDLPASLVGGLLFDVGALGIVWLDADGDPYPGSTRPVGPVKEGALLARYAADLSAFATGWLAERLDEYPALTEPIAAGRYAGQSAFEVLRDAGPDDVRAFLDFVRSYPGKYLGGTWQLNETVATWLINDAPYGEESLRDRLLALPDAEALAALRATLAEESQAPTGYPAGWRETAEAWGAEGRRDEARRLLALATEAARLMDLPGDVASGAFSLGILSAQEGRYAEANRQYRLAAPAAAAAGQGATAAIAYANVSLNLLTSGDPAAAVAAADTARALAAGESGYVRGLAAERRARALHALGRLDDAVAGFDAAAEAYASDPGTAAAERAAGLGRARGDLFEDQGRFAEALAAHLAARDAARALADPEGEADALDEAAYAASRLGRHEEAIGMWREAEALHVRAGERSDAGYSLSQVGQTAWTLGRCDEARAAHRAAIEHRRAAGDRVGEAYSWRQLGALFAETGDPVEADRAFARALALYEAAGSTSGQADVALARAENAATVGDDARAEAAYRQAVALAAGLPADRAGALASLGWVLARLGRLPEARAAYEDALRIQRELGDRAAQSRTLRQLGRFAHFQEGRLDAAREALDEALALAEATGAPAERSDAHLALAALDGDTGRPDAAGRHLDAALALAEDAGDVARQIDAALAASYRASTGGAYADALAHAERARALADASGNRVRLVDALTALGRIDLELGAFDRAAGRYEVALAAAEGAGSACGTTPNPWALAAVRTSQGDLLTRTSHFADALARYALADSLYASVGDEIAQATVANNRANAYFFQAEFDAALASFQEALALLDRQGLVNPFRAILLANIAEVRMAMDDPAVARVGFDEAVALADRLGARDLLATALTLRGELARRSGDAEAAGADLERALALARSQGTPEALLTVAAPLGRLRLAADSLAAADSLLSEAAALAAQTGFDLFLWEPLFVLGQVRERQGRPDEALALYERSLRSMEAVRSRVVGGEDAQRRFARAGSKAEVYEATAAALLAQGRVEEAMAVVERSLSEALGRQFGRLDLEGTPRARTQTRVRQLRSTTEGLERTLAQARAEAAAGAAGAAARAAALEDRLEVAQDEYAAFLRDHVRGDRQLEALNPRATPVEDFRRERRALPDDTAVLAYLVGESRLFAFVATRDTVAAVVTPIGAKDMTVLVADAVQGMSDPDGPSRARTDEEAPAPGAEADWEGASAELYRILIEPLAGLIGDRDHLAIAPTGVLHYLPFAALRYRGADGAPRYLAQDAAVAGITSFSIFARAVDDRPVRVRAFGNADATLAFAEAEVEGIRARLPDTEVWVREEATETRAKADPEAFTVLHLATHGTLRFDDFEASYLTLARDDGDDGRLTLDEVGSLDFPYRLVTLSACNTGVGDGASEAWPVNPANTFLASGAESVVATLWAVDDLATSEFMGAFYEHLQAADTADALRQAQLALLAVPEFAHPFYWAPFVMLGDWE